MSQIESVPGKREDYQRGLMALFIRWVNQRSLPN